MWLGRDEWVKIADEKESVDRLYDYVDWRVFSGRLHQLPPAICLKALEARLAGVLATSLFREYQMGSFGRELAQGPFGLWILYVETGLLELWPSSLKMLGYSDDETWPTVCHWSLLVHPEDRDQGGMDPEEFSAQSSGGYVSAHRLLTSTGNWKFVGAIGRERYTPSIGGVSPNVKWGIHFDLSEEWDPSDVVLTDWFRLTASAKARAEAESRRWYGVFAYLSPMLPFFKKDRQLKYTWINPQGEELLGLSSDQILGRTDQDLVGRDAELFGRDAELFGRDLDDPPTNGPTGTPRRFPRFKIVAVAVGGRKKLLFEVIFGPDTRDEEDWWIIAIESSLKDATGLSQLVDAKYESSSMNSTLAQASFAAGTDMRVILEGETGTGKDWLARYIHDNSARKDGPYFSINCAALPSNMVESELFGYEKGAFTGAYTRKIGLVELAQGGTLFLNEIGELPSDLQSKLLTFLDTNSFTRLGGRKPITLDARIIAATNRDLDHEMSTGTFRADFFARLAVLRIRVPPLKERLEDIPILVKEMLPRLLTELKIKDQPTFHQSALDKLQQYHWPRNVRELRNVLEVALARSKGTQIGPEHIDLGKSQGSVYQPPASTTIHKDDSSDTELKPVDQSVQPVDYFIEVTDEGLKLMYEHVCKKQRGAITAMATVLGTYRTDISLKLKGLGCDRGTLGSSSKKARRAMNQDLKSWLDANQHLWHKVPKDPEQA